MDQAIFRWVETLNKAISKQCSCFARKFESQISNIFDAHHSKGTLRWNLSHGKRMYIAIVERTHPYQQRRTSITVLRLKLQEIM